MLQDLILTSSVLALSVVIHAVALSYLLRWLSRRSARATLTFWRSTWLLVGVTFRLIISHVLQVISWGALYFFEGVFPDFASAAYFSIATYATVGYGDLVPSVPWRWAAGVEGLAGILMCGWSTAFFFAVVTRFYRPLGGEPPG